MTNFWEDDLDVFYSVNTPGCIQVTFGSSTIWVHWFNEYEPINLFDGVIESKNPHLRAKDSDVIGITHSSTFIKDSVTYKVINIMPDGAGETLVDLSKD